MNNMSYDSKHSGAVAEQMLDDYVAGNLGGGGMPTEVIKLSSEITLQEGKMLEINHTTPVVDTLTLKTPSITDTTQGLLFGIRFTCGASTPQLTFGGMLAFVGSWANGELPQLEPNVTVEIIGVKVASPSTHFLLSWAIYK